MSPFLKRIGIIGFLFIFAVGVGVYALMRAPSQEVVSEQDRAELRVGVANAGGEFSSVVIVADSQGYFADEGLDVTLSKEVSGVRALKGLREGTLDIVTASDFAFVNSSFLDASAKIIATIDAADGVEVIVRRDAGISSPSDLKGKKIGVVPQTAAEFVLGRFLTMNNLSLTNVTVVNLTYSAAEEAIVSGDVDAVIINNPFAYDISKTLDTNGISWPAQYGQPLLFNAISSDGVIDSRPEAVEGFLRALVRAEEFVEQNPTQAKEVVRESFSFTQDYIDQLWDNHVFAVRLDQALFPTLEAQARWLQLYKADGSTDIPNYFRRVHVDALSNVAPEAVTVIQ